MRNYAAGGIDYIVYDNLYKDRDLHSTPIINKLESHRRNSPLLFECSFSTEPEYARYLGDVAYDMFYDDLYQITDDIEECECEYDEEMDDCRLEIMEVEYVVFE